MALISFLPNLSGATGAPDFVITLPGGKADLLGTSFATFADAAVYEDLKDGVSDVPGPGGDPADITVTGQGGDGYESPVIGAILEGRRNNHVVELALDYSTVGLTKFQVERFEYAIIRTAVSNPSAPTDLFANDHFVVSGESVEYDNVRLTGTPSWVPEPSRVCVLVLGALGLLSIRFRVR